MKKVIELIRVSTIQQAGEDRFSIPAQRTINRRTAAAFGLTIVRTIELADVGGSDVLSAPEIQELLKLIQAPEIDGVVAREFSRLMRPENLADFSLLQNFADSNTLLYLPDGPIDFAAKTGRLLGTIRAALAGMEKTELLERSQGAREEMRKQGKCPSAPMTWPTGVAYDKQRGWFYSSEISKVEQCFEMFLSGIQNWGEIARATGVSQFNVRGILSNPIYTGWRVYDKKRDRSREARYVQVNGRQSDRRKMLRAPEDVIRVKVIDDPIISEADFARVQQMLAEKRDRHIRARYTNFSRFTYHGFLTCSACGSPEYGHSYKSKDGLISDYYACSAKRSQISNRPNPIAAKDRCPTRYMRREKLEPHIDGIFSTRLTDRKFLSGLVDELEERATSKGSEKKTERLEANLARLEQKRSRILDGFFEGVIDREERDRRVSTLERERAGIEKALGEINPAAPSIDVDQLVMLFRPLFTWRTLPADSKRRILFSLVPEIKVADYVVAGLSLIVPIDGDETLNKRPPSSARGLFPRRESYGDYANRRTTGPLITEPSSRLYIPLNL